MPDPSPLPADAAFVGPTAATYESDTDRFVEKYRASATADRFGDRFGSALPDVVTPRVLDVGCGPGVDAAVFAADGFDVVGVDVARGLVAAADAEVDDAAFTQGDMRRLPFAADAFDGLWASASFLHLSREDADATLAEFARVLREDGALFLSVMAREPRPVDAAELADGRRFTFWRKDDLFDRVADAGFRVVWDSGQTDWHALVAVAA